MPMPTWRPRILRKGPRNAKPTAAQLAAQDWLPVLTIRDGCLIRPDGGVVAGVKIAPFSLALKSERERAAAVQGFQAALNGLAVPWQIVSQYRPVDLDAYLNHLDGLHTEASGPRRQALGEYALWVHSLVQAGETVDRRYYLLLHRQGKDAVAEHRTAIRGLLDDLGRIRGFRAAVMTDADWLEPLFLLFHAGQAAVEPIPDGWPRPTPLYRPKAKEVVPVAARPKASQAVPNALKNLIAPEALDFRPQFLLAGPEWRVVYTIQAFPPTVDDGWLTKVANLPGVTFSLHAMPQDPYHLVQAINRRIGAIQGQLALGKVPALAAQRLERELADAQALLRQIDAEQQAVFQVGIYLVVAAPDAETGQRRAKRLVGQLAAQGMRARPLVFRQEEGMRAAGPFALWPERLRGDHLWPAATLAAGWPFGAGGINHGRGIVLGHDADGGIVLVDRWNPPPEHAITNKNFAILSPPGGGKSHATKLMVLREWAMGAKVFVIDPEREYRPLCRAVGGTWINAAGGGTRINPLQTPALPPDVDEEGAAGSGLPTHIQRVLDFFRTYAPDLTPMQRALLEAAVEAAYRERGIALDAPPEALARLGPEAWPHVGDVYAYCRAQNGPEWATLAALLRTAGEGILAELWAGPSTVPPTQDANFVVVDIHDLQDAPDNVRRAQYLNVLGYLWDLVRADRSERKVLVVDEAWMLIDPRAPEALKFMKSLSKRIRKYGGSFCVVTQNVIDFLADAVRGDGEQVLTNAAFTLLLRQGGKDLQALSGLLQLSDAEQDRLANARVGEGLLIAGNQRAWVTIDTAPHEAAYLYGRGGG